MAGYVARLAAIRDSLDESADNLEEREPDNGFSDTQQDKLDAYRSAADAIGEAIEALESI